MERETSATRQPNWKLFFSLPLAPSKLIGPVDSADTANSPQRSALSNSQDVALQVVYLDQEADAILGCISDAIKRSGLDQILVESVRQPASSPIWGEMRGPLLEGQWRGSGSWRSPSVEGHPARSRLLTVVPCHCVPSAMGAENLNINPHIIKQTIGTAPLKVNLGFVSCSLKC